MEECPQGKEVKLTVFDLSDWNAGGERRRAFVEGMGNALRDVGFFALTGHNIDAGAIRGAYSAAKSFFELPQEEKDTYGRHDPMRQRGYTPFGVEHARDNPTPDLKEFWQAGRANSTPENVWPREPTEFERAIGGLYASMETLSVELLAAASLYLGKDASWLPGLVENGNTILRIIHYPPLGDAAPVGAVRSAAHEDINFITLLVGATADGLQVLDRDGTWIDVKGNDDHIIVDSGDMLQNITNGIFKSTTHRVVNPPDVCSERYSMPLFVHPRDDVDLTPRSEFVELTGGNARYDPIGAAEYLRRRLVEIGLKCEPVPEVVRATL